MGVGTRVKDILGDSDIRQKVFAKQIGIAESSMSNYLREVRVMPYDILVQIARELDTTTDYLLGAVENPTRPLGLSSTEKEMLLAYRTLSKEQKELILQNIKLMRAQNQR